MDIYEAVRSRRAVRGFTDLPVSREVLERVLSAAAWAPSGSNIQLQTVMLLLRAEGLHSCPADGVVGVSQDRRRDPVTPG